LDANEEDELTVDLLKQQVLYKMNGVVGAIGSTLNVKADAAEAFQHILTAVHE